jgi:hypothetical protein
MMRATGVGRAAGREADEDADRRLVLGLRGHRHTERQGSDEGLELSKRGHAVSVNREGSKSPQHCGWAASRLQVMRRITEQLIDDEQALGVVAGAAFVGHAHRAVKLDGGEADLAAELAGQGLRGGDDAARCCASPASTAIAAAQAIDFTCSSAISMSATRC